MAASPDLSGALIRAAGVRCAERMRMCRRQLCSRNLPCDREGSLVETNANLAVRRMYTPLQKEWDTPIP